MDPLLGTIQMFAMNFSPRSWSFCNGSLVSISQNNALFALLGTTYGGDGRTTFALPPLSSRSPMGWSMGGGAGLPHFRWGQQWGMPEKVLTLSELPAHSHNATFTPMGGGGAEAAEVYATTDLGGSATPSEGAFLAQTDPTGGGQDKPEKIYKSSPTPGSLVSLGGVSGGGGGISGGTVTVGTTGANHSFDLYHPSVAITFSIAMQGIFPSRNS